MLLKLQSMQKWDDGTLVVERPKYRVFRYRTTEGALRSLQRSFGECTHTIFQEDATDDDLYPIGWVFEKQQKFADVEEYFIEQTWVEVINNRHIQNLERLYSTR
jgi:hypothetical protein